MNVRNIEMDDGGHQIHGNKALETMKMSINECDDCTLSVTTYKNQIFMLLNLNKFKINPKIFRKTLKKSLKVIKFINCKI